MSLAASSVRPANEDLVARRAAAVHTVEVDGEAVLLDEARNRLHLLNRTGTLVWACLDGASSVAEIVADLSEGLGVPYALALRDTLAVIDHLAEEGLLDEEAVPRARPAGFTEPRWHRVPDLLARRSLDAVLLLPRGAEAPVTLPGTAAEVWDLLASPTPLTAIAAELAARHDADPAVVAADVGTLLDRLADLGAVKQAP
jgi:hypothetical protein